MADTQFTRTGEDRPAAVPEPTGWVGWVIFAGVILLIEGIFQAIWGLVALFKDELFVVRPNGLVIDIDYTAWGWTQLLIGVAVALTGIAVMAGQTWARVVAIILAGLSAIANFLSLGAYPVWSAIMITIAVLVIYALAVHGAEAKAMR